MTRGSVGSGWGGERGEIGLKIKDCAEHGIFMARQYRQTIANTKQVTTGGDRFFKIEPLDNDQVPDGYVDKVKVSVQVLSQQPHLPISQILVYASGDATNPGDMITAQALNGSGTVWLSLKRKISSDNSEPARNDGQVDIWIDAGPACNVTAVAEAWGRFIELGL